MVVLCSDSIFRFVFYFYLAGEKSFMNSKDLYKIIDSIPSQKEVLIQALVEFNQSLSFREMAKILGSGHAFLSRVINGKQDASLETLAGYVRKLLEFEKG